MTLAPLSAEDAAAAHEQLQLADAALRAVADTTRRR